MSDRGIWLVWSGKRWEVDKNSLFVAARAKRLADALLEYALEIPHERRGNLLDHWMKWQKLGVRESVVKDACSELALKVTDLDTDFLLFNVDNGTLNLNTQELQPHKPSDFITKLAPVSFDPGAEYARFPQFVTEIMAGDPEMMRYLQKSLSYALTGSVELEKLFIWYGATTRNGKSTLAESMLGLVGDYGAVLPAESLSTLRKSRGNEASADIARLQGVRCVMVSEPARSTVLNAALVKNLTGGDTVIARSLYQDFFEYKPTHKLFMHTNYLPRVNDPSLFDSGRVAVVPFPVHFPEKVQDRKLKAKFATPMARSAMLNWVLEGLRLYHDEGLDSPKPVSLAVGDYARESDALAQFMEAWLEPDITGEVRTSELLKLYQVWALDNNFPKEGKVSFKAMLERTGLTVVRRRPITGGSQATLVLGYRLKQSDSSD
jgi:putative DNA primase/helicase